jgi:hypothetical protein
MGFALRGRRMENKYGDKETNKMLSNGDNCTKKSTQNNA